jgi:hypothetical protein
MEEQAPAWHMRPAVVYAVFFTGLGLSNGALVAGACLVGARRRIRRPS